MNRSGAFDACVFFAPDADKPPAPGLQPPASSLQSDIKSSRNPFKRLFAAGLASLLSLRGFGEVCIFDDWASGPLPGRLMAGQRPLKPYVEVRILPGQLFLIRNFSVSYGAKFFSK